MYPQLAPLAGAREVRVPLDDAYEHDLEAMVTEITAATQLVIVCNPNNPTGTALPLDAVVAFLDRVPDHVTVILDEAYIEMQTLDHPDATVDLLPELPEPRPTADVQQGLRPRRPALRLRARLRPVPRRRRCGPPALRRQRARPGGGGGGPAALRRHVGRVERTIAERIEVEDALHDLGLTTAETQTNFSWIDLGDRDEAEIVEGLGKRGIIVRAGHAARWPRATSASPTAPRPRTGAS